MRRFDFEGGLWFGGDVFFFSLGLTRLSVGGGWFRGIFEI